LNTAVIAVPPMRWAGERGARWCGRAVPSGAASRAGRRGITRWHPHSPSGSKIMGFSITRCKPGGSTRARPIASYNGALLRVPGTKIIHFAHDVRMAVHEPALHQAKPITDDSGPRAGAPDSSRGRRWARLPAVVAGSAAVLGVVCFPGPVALAGSWPVLTWTKQHPATSPAAMAGAPMAYDAATGTVVLFGGITGSAGHHTWLRGTWTWSAS
jgi:hypothetical protein